MIAADIPWYVPLLVFVVGVVVLAALTLRNGRRLHQIDDKLDAIDHAVNGQPIGTLPMVDKVAIIKDDIAEITLRAEIERDAKSNDPQDN